MINADLRRPVASQLTTNYLYLLLLQVQVLLTMLLCAAGCALHNFQFTKKKLSIPGIFASRRNRAQTRALPISQARVAYGTSTEKLSLDLDRPWCYPSLGVYNRRDRRNTELVTLSISPVDPVQLTNS